MLPSMSRNKHGLYLVDIYLASSSRCRRCHLRRGLGSRHSLERLNMDFRRALELLATDEDLDEEDEDEDD